MGAFGTSSDDNDTSWDVLGHCVSDPSVFPSTQAEADACVAWIAAGFPDSREGYQAYWAMGDESETVLGPIVYLLREGFTVNADTLRRALEIARTKRRDRDYLACWCDDEDRIDALAEEIVLIRKAINAAK